MNRVIAVWRCLTLLVMFGLLSACADLRYLHQAAVGHLQLVWNARPVDEVLADPQTPDRLLQQLQAARQIRRFAVEALELPDNRSYTRYVDTGQRFVVWNVLATPELSLTLETSCFLVVGCLSYRGFYAEADAREHAQALRQRGLNAVVAGVPAYSTLGWTPDPLLNTFVFYPRGELARLVFHELAHQVLYIADDTAFNESFASAVEELGVERWLAEQADPQIRREYVEYDARRRVFQNLLMQTRAKLAQIFAAGDLSDAEKTRQRDSVLEDLQNEYLRVRNGLWNGYGGYDRFFKDELTVPRLAGFGIYRQWVPAFKALFARCDQRFSCFYKAAAELGRLPRSTREQRLTAMENPELANAVLLPDLVVCQRAGCNDRHAVTRLSHLSEVH